MLSVVIPTRNRHRSLTSLLEDLRGQSLPPTRFEVIVVDDGSEPPVVIEQRLPFRLAVLRRDEAHGAHASRKAGLLLARGARVLFLDDDLNLPAGVLAAHVSPITSGRIALGPIAYPPAENGTPFRRYMSRFYAVCNEALLRDRENLSPRQFYICNSSAPTDLFVRAFDLLAERSRGELIGGGFDESLLAEIFVDLREAPVCVEAAMLWHLDTKTLAEGCREARLSTRAIAEALRAGWFEGRWGAMSGNSGPRAVRGALRRAVMGCYWLAPRPFQWLAGALEFIAEHGPCACVPAWACRIPLTVARWEGWRSAIPAYRHYLDLVDRPADGGLSPSRS